MSAYTMQRAPTFDRHRALPDGVPQAIRAAVLAAVDAASPRLLDLGAGTGRIGWPFVAAGDDYVGVDLSFGMLRAFAQRARQRPRAAPGAGGRRAPAVSRRHVRRGHADPGVRRHARLAAAARRGAARAARRRRAGARPHGRAARRPRRADEAAAGAAARRDGRAGRSDEHARQDAQGWLEQRRAARAVVAATWTAERTPRGFIERHRTGARFSALPAPVKEEALRRLAAWAATTFGSLDAASSEPHAFELQLFKFS